MAVPANTTTVMVDTALPVSPVILQLGDGSTRTVGGVRRVFSAAGVTDASGNVTFTFVPAFAATPVVEGQVGPSGDTALVECRLTAVSTASATFNVRRSPSVVILGISVLQVPANAPGVTVQCIAVEAGAV